LGYFAGAGSADGMILEFNRICWPNFLTNCRDRDAAAVDPDIGSRSLVGSRPWGERNDLELGQRLGWIAIIAIGSSLAFGSILAALAALKALI
jgi:hypothetical protein